MLLSEDVFTTTITRATRVTSRRSFGAAMIVAYLTWMVDRVRIYSEPEEMLDDGCPDDAPEYLAAVAFCAQENRPRQFKIGRRAGAPTQTFRLTPATPTEGEEYSLTFGGVTFAVEADATPTVAEITAALTLAINADADAIIASGGASSASPQTITTFNGVQGGTLSPPRNVVLTFSSHADWDSTTAVVTGVNSAGRTVTENFAIPNGGGAAVTGSTIFASITSILIPAQSGIGGTFTAGVGALFANADLDITATDGTTHVDIACDDVGAWFALTDVTSNLAIEDRTAQPGTTLATDLAAIREADADWSGLVVADAQSAAQIAAVATWAETQPGLLYVAHSLDTAITQDVDTDIATTLLDASRLRTKVFYNRSSHGTAPDAAFFGAFFAFDPGSASAEYKTLSGVVADDLSTTVITRLVGSKTAPADSKRCMVYVEIGARGTNRGNPVTFGGLTAGGEWMDRVRGLDWVESELAAVSTDLQLANPKVPFTDEGIDIFDGAVRGVLQRAARPPYNLLIESTISTQPTPLADVPDAERAARYYDGVRFSAETQGAIRAGRFRGTVT
jgi:hypothetical protein